MAKVQNLDEVRNAYTKLQQIVEGTEFESFFKSFSPYEAYNAINNVLSVVELNEEIKRVKESEKEIEALSDLYYCALYLKDRMFDLQHFVYLPQFIKEGDFSKDRFISSLTKSISPGSMAVSLDQMIFMSAAQDVNWTDRTIECLQALKRIYWRLTIESSNKEHIKNMCDML